MIVPRDHLTILLNALYETDTRRVTVSHPCRDVGELLQFELGNPFGSSIRFTQSLNEYTDSRETVQREYGPDAYDDLPDASAYVRCLVASGVLDVQNRDAIETYVRRHGYRDLEAGHAPLVLGIDANIMPWRIADVLDLDHQEGDPDDRGRSPTNGYALASGVEDELDWHYKQHQTASLVAAFGEEFERLDNQPAGDNREGFLGLYEYRRLIADRNIDILDSDTGDEAIVDGYRAFEADSRKEVLLLSNDFGFIELAEGADLLAQHVDFPRSLPSKTTATWDDFGSLLYYVAVRFGVVRLPSVTLYGLWNGKDGRHWQNEALVVEPRSPKVTPLLERDRTIMQAFED